MCCFDCFYPKNKNRKQTSIQSLGSSMSHNVMAKQKPSRALTSASSPSRLDTTDITMVYEVPNKKYKTEDDVINGNGYELMYDQKLGTGSYSLVYKTKRLKDQMIVACKVMDISDDKDSKKLTNYAKNELFVLEKTSHPHIIHIDNHFILKNNSLNQKHVYLFMPLADNNSLSQYMRSRSNGMDESSARQMFAQIVSAVLHMHHKNIAHRDLKMGNILLDRDMNVLVSDFGLSKVMFRQSEGGTAMSEEYVGTLPYMAPEILVLKINKSGSYNSFMADVWALGVILYAMINKAYPFGDSKSRAKDLIKIQIVFNPIRVTRSRHSPTISKDYEDLIQRIFTFNSESRITMNEISKHKWIRDEMKTIDEKIEAQNQLSVPMI